MRQKRDGTLTDEVTQGREAMRARVRISVAATVGALVVFGVAADLAPGAQFALPAVQSSSTGVSSEGDGVSATASCPQTTRLVSGGFSTSLVDSHGPVVVDASAAGRDTWQVGANEYGGGSDGVTALANCARGAPPEHVSEASASLDVGSPPTSATAQCPNTSEAIAGGFVTSYDGASRAGNVVFESRRVGSDSWRVSAVHAMNGGPTDLTAVAYCGHAPDLVTQAHTVQIASGPAPVQSDATCPAGTNAVSGGFSSSVEVGQFTLMAFPAASSLRDAQTWSAQGVYPGLGGPFDFTAYAYCAPAR
jgi:hypothetical protein